MVQKYKKKSEVGLYLYVYPYNHSNLSGFMFRLPEGTGEWHHLYHQHASISHL